jgi:hypothetical protein
MGRISTICADVVSSVLWVDSLKLVFVEIVLDFSIISVTGDTVLVNTPDEDYA